MRLPPVLRFAPWLLLFLLPPPVMAQCLTPELALINSCIEHPNPNGSTGNVESELLVITSGIAPVPVAEFGVDVPFNGFGAANADIGVDVNGNPLGCTFREPAITSLPGCDNVVPLGPEDVIPANSIVVFFTTGTTVSEDLSEVDFSNICPQGEPVYVVQNACERTAGAFANSPPASGDPLRTVTVISDCGLRGFTYNTRDLNPDEGTYYLVGLNELGNLNCALPVIPETCPVIDTTFFVCDAAGEQPTVPAQDLASIYPEDVLSVSFHPTPLEAEGNMNRITEYQTTGMPTDTIYARIINSSNFCIAIGTLVIAYQAGPAITFPPAEPLRGCDPEGDGTGVFDLRLGDLEIGGGQPVTYYTDPIATMEITDPGEYISSAGTIFARAGLLSCNGNIVPVQLETDSGPEVFPMASPTSCPTNQDGVITLAATGFGQLSYAWANDTFQPAAGQTQLAPGTYPWTVTDASGCQTSGATTVPAGTTVQLSCQTLSGVSAPGASDGEIGITVSDGNGPYEVVYSGAAAGAVTSQEAMFALTGLPAGNYSLQVTDADGCPSAACTTNIGLVDPIVLDCAVRNNANGTLVLGAITATVDGGEPPFTVTLADGNGGTTTLTGQARGEITFDNLGVGTYTITVADAAGQTTSCTQTITQDNCPLQVTYRLLVTDCSGGDNSVISLDIAGFQGTINTVWSGGNNISIFDGMNEAGPLPPGNYFVEVNDQSGCPPMMLGPIVVEDRGFAVFDVVEVLPSAACADDGAVAIVPTSGGIAPYTVVLEDAAGNEVGRQTVAAYDTVRFTGLPGDAAGTMNYLVQVVDDFGCADAATGLTVGREPEPVIMADPALTPPSCQGGDDGSISLTVSGGAMPHTFVWLDYPQRTDGRVLDPGPDQTNLPAGDYTVAVTESGGCSDTLLVELPDGPRPIVFCGITTPVTGNSPGTVSLSLASDSPPLILTFLTPDGQQVVRPGEQPGDVSLPFSEPGDYLVFGRDANGCVSDSCIFNIGEIPCAVTASAMTDPVDCTGAGQIVVVPTGGTAPYEFSWAEPSFPARDTVLPVAAGDYAVTISDQNGCTLDTFFTVGVLDNRPSFNGDSLRVLPACAGDSVLIPVSFNGSAPFTLTYSVVNTDGPQASDATAVLMATDTLRLPAGWFSSPGATLTASLLADQRCSSPQNLSTSYELTRPDTIRRTDISCRPEGLMIGGRLFTAAMPADTFAVDDGSACGQIYEVNLTFLEPEVPDTLEVFLCPGEDYIVPETGDVFNAGRPEGEVAYTRPGQCDSLVYLRLDIPEVFIGSFSASACEGDTVFLGDRFFTIDGPSGLATLAGQAASGCDSLVAVNVNFRRVGELRLLGDHEICPGDSLELRFAYDGQGGVNARLENLQGDILDLSGVRDGDRFLLTPGQSTTWSIVSVEAGGCPGEFSGRSQITISDFALSTAILTDPAEFCQDTLGRIIALPAGGMEPYTITWSNGPRDSLNPNLLPGTYGVSVTDADGCTLQDSVLLTDRSDLRVALRVVPPVCEGQAGRLELDSISGEGGLFDVSLDGEFFLPVERIEDFRADPGLGEATFRDMDGCTEVISFFVPEALQPGFNARRDTTIFLGDSLLLGPGVSVDFDTAFWTPPATLSTPNSLTTFARPLETTDYSLSLVSSEGCALTYRIRVTVDERLPVYAPTAFSPNGDNVNDTYRLAYSDRVVEVRAFQIFNRWGTMVHDGPQGWDGMLNGQPAEPAVYVFQAVVVMQDGSERFVKGDFVLRR